VLLSSLAARRAFQPVRATVRFGATPCVVSAKDADAAFVSSRSRPAPTFTPYARALRLRVGRVAVALPGRSATPANVLDTNASGPSTAGLWRTRNKRDDCLELLSGEQGQRLPSEIPSPLVQSRQSWSGHRLVEIRRRCLGTGIHRAHRRGARLLWPA